MVQVGHLIFYWCKVSECVGLVRPHITNINRDDTMSTDLDLTDLDTDDLDTEEVTLDDDSETPIEKAVDSFQKGLKNPQNSTDAFDVGDFLKKKIVVSEWSEDQDCYLEWEVLLNLRDRTIRFRAKGSFKDCQEWSFEDWAELEKCGEDLSLALKGVTW